MLLVFGTIASWTLKIYPDLLFLIFNESTVPNRVADTMNFEFVLGTFIIYNGGRWAYERN